MSAETVTFQTVLDIARETPKAFKILTSSYLPKSLVTVEVLWEEDRAPYFGAKHLVSAQHVNVTMPKWLSKKL